MFTEIGCSADFLMGFLRCVTLDGSITEKKNMFRFRSVINMNFLNYFLGVKLYNKRRTACELSSTLLVFPTTI